MIFRHDCVYLMFIYRNFIGQADDGRATLYVKNPDLTVGASPPPFRGAFGSRWEPPRLTSSWRTRLALRRVVKTGKRCVLCA